VTTAQAPTGTEGTDWEGQAVESISIRKQKSRGFLVPPFACFAVGAQVNVTKKTRELPESEQRQYFVLELSHDENAEGEVVYPFCEREHVEKVAAAIRETGGAVPVTVTLRLGRDSLNVSSVEIATGRK
jgi:hypothetical protein